VLAPERDDSRDNRPSREWDAAGDGKNGSCDGDPGVARKTLVSSSPSPLAVVRLDARYLLANAEKAVGADACGLDMV
jgi:hypothetical protein